MIKNIHDNKKYNFLSFGYEKYKDEYIHEYEDEKNPDFLEQNNGYSISFERLDTLMYVENNHNKRSYIHKDEILAYNKKTKLFYECVFTYIFYIVHGTIITCILFLFYWTLTSSKNHT